MEPILTSAASSFPWLIRRAIASWSEAALDIASDENILKSPWFYLVPSSDGSAAGILADSQLADIQEFLATREVSALLQVLALRHLLPVDQSEAITEDFAEAFGELARQWCLKSRQEWSDLAAEIWAQCIDYYNSVLPRNASTYLPRNELQRILASARVPAQLSGAAPTAPAFVRGLLTAIMAPARLAGARQATTDLLDAARSMFPSMRLNHAQEDYRYSFGSLYVDRDLVERTSGRSVSSNDVLGPGQLRPRCVIIGDPGVGKSTLVEHLIHSLTSQPEDPPATVPILLRCREYAFAGQEVTLLDALLAQVTLESSYQVDREALIDLLHLGRVFVMFDGIDEIIDLSFRRKVVDRIQAFSTRYPLSPIIVTGRKVGYSQAPFDRVHFDVYELEEYSDEQMEDYVSKWFLAAERPAIDRQAFLRESATVGDIRTNPLMLSLLCILYRARGYIPRNRREVYRECADLLFYRWDSMRRIEQPFDHRKFGIYLMQELAHFFYKHPRTQSGIDDQQLEGIAAGYFSDTAGVPREEARQRATDFLDYCSGRAWLLTSKGTGEHGQRIFTFTHRTFFEYFTAEAIVRKAGNIDAIVPIVVSSHRGDSSSVLPELITQCTDDKFERGAEHLIGQLLGTRNTASSSILSLCLRLINSAPVGGSISERVLRSVLRSWRSNEDRFDYEMAIAFFELYRDPRARVSQIIDNEKGDASLVFKEELLARWLRLDSLGEAATFRQDWETTVTRYFEDLRGLATQVSDPLLRARLVVTGDLQLSRRRLEDRGESLFLLAFSAFGRHLAGPGLASLLRVLKGQGEASDVQLVEKIATTLLANLHVPGTTVESMVEVLNEHEVAALRKGSTDREHVPAAALHFALWISFVLYEYSNRRRHEFDRVLDSLLGRKVFPRLALTRNYSLGESISQRLRSQIGPPYGASQIRSVVPSPPEWIWLWCKGKSLLLERE